MHGAGKVGIANGVIGCGLPEYPLSGHTLYAKTLMRICTSSAQQPGKCRVLNLNHSAPVPLLRQTSSSWQKWSPSFISEWMHPWHVLSFLLMTKHG